MKRNNKKLIVFVAVIILTISLASNGFAANTIANLKAHYKNITVYKNGILFNFSKEPFIVDGTTYVPLRDMAEMLDKEVTWDGTNYKIGVNDKPGQNPNEFYAQIVGLQQQIVQLQNENKKLKEQLANSSADLDDLEDDLNDNYTKIGKKLSIQKIVLDGDKEEIEVEIYISTKKDADYDAWHDLDDDDIEDFLQDIVDDILKVYKNADITGFIEDQYEKEKVVKFSITSKGVVKLGSSSSKSGSLGDLEDDLNDDYRKIAGIKIEEIILKGDKDDIEVQIYVDLTDAQYNKFIKIDDDDMEEFLQDIVDDILKEFKNANITGYIHDDYDNSKLLTFKTNSKGVVSVSYKY